MKSRAATRQHEDRSSRATSYPSKLDALTHASAASESKSPSWRECLNVVLVAAKTILNMKRKLLNKSSRRKCNTRISFMPPNTPHPSEEQVTRKREMERFLEAGQKDEDSRFLIGRDAALLVALSSRISIFSWARQLHSSYTVMCRFY